MLLTTTTEPGWVQAHYQREGTLLALEIPMSVSPQGLQQIARTHADLPQRDCVLELVIAHRRCDVATLELVLELAEDSASVLNSVATSGKASREILRRLAQSEILSVRDHAEFALIDRQLDEADDDGIAKIYQAHRDHPSWGYGFRYRLVSDSRTPRSVLDSIASYRDPVGTEAQRRLGQEATG